MGSAALYHLARRGTVPIGVDRFQTDHSFGSSFGHSRAIRTFYHDALYVDWAKRALPLWRELEQVSGQKLLRLPGTIYFAGQENLDFRRNVRILQDLGIPFEILNTSQATRRFSGFEPPRNTISCYTAEAGFLDPSRCVRTHVSEALRHGAVIREQVAFRSIDLSGERPVLETSEESYRCSRLILSCGPWTADFLPELYLPLTVTRQQKFYFSPQDGDENLYRHLPVYIDYDHMFYGFPPYGPGLKVAEDRLGEITHPDRINRNLDDEKKEQLRDWVQRLLPKTRWKFQTGFTCMYTMTPDLDFLLGPHPLNSNLLVAAGFSGHGFKFSTLVGEILADLAMHGHTAHPIDRFRLDRFRGTGTDDQPPDSIQSL